MKGMRVIVLLLCVVFVVMFTACTTKNEGDSSTTNNYYNNNPPPPLPPPLVGPVDVVSSPVQWSSEGFVTSFGPPEGMLCRNGKDNPYLSGSYMDNAGDNDNSGENFTDVCFIPFHEYDNIMDTYIGTAYLMKDYMILMRFEDPIAYNAANATDVNNDLMGAEFDTVVNGRSVVNTITEALVMPDMTLSAIEFIRSTRGFDPVWMQKLDSYGDDLEYRFYQDENCKGGCMGYYIEVQLVDVSDSEDMCGISVDGDVAWIREGEVGYVNGVPVGVLDVAISADYNDLCEVVVGAEQVKIENNGSVIVNGVGIDGASGMVTSTTSGGAGKLISVGYSMDPQDQLWLNMSSEPYFDPISHFQLFFMTPSSEEILWESWGNWAELEFTTPWAYTGQDSQGNKIYVGGWQIQIPMFSPGNGIALGEDTNELVITDPLLCPNCAVTASAASIADLEGTKVLVMDSFGVAHVLEVTDINTLTAPYQLDIKDLSAGITYADIIWDAYGTGNVTLGTNPWNIGTISLQLENISGTYYLTASDVNLADLDYMPTLYSGQLRIRMFGSGLDQVLVDFTDAGGFNFLYLLMYDGVDSSIAAVSVIWEAGASVKDFGNERHVINPNGNVMMFDMDNWDRILIENHAGYPEQGYLFLLMGPEPETVSVP